jgi:hypothetical protein
MQKGTRGERVIDLTASQKGLKTIKLAVSRSRSMFGILDIEL